MKRAVAEIMALVWLLVGLGILSAFLLNLRRYRLAAKLPGPKLWVPGFGNLIDTLLCYGFSGVEWIKGYYERYGNVYAMWVGHSFLLVTSNPRDIEAIVTSSAFIDKGSNYSLLSPWLGDGLLLSSGKKWHSRRKLLTPTFHFRILEQFIDVYNEKGTILEAKLEELVGKGAVDVRPYISRHALDVICETAMGTQMNVQVEENSEYVQAIKVACKTVDDRHAYPWLSNETLFRMTRMGKEFFKALGVIHGVTQRVIDKRKAELQNELKSGEKQVETVQDDIGSKKRMMFIDQLLTMHLQGADLSEKDIFDEVNTFMFEGHDTTMTSVCFTLYLLSQHPEVQERVAQEVLLVTGSSPHFTAAHLAELKYLEAVIKESLRLYPSVPCFFRECKEEYKLPSGYTIPARTTILINAFMAHHDEKNFTDPLTFNPERFVAGNEDHQRHNFAYIPFSAGYRNCIGQRFAMMSMKATLARILRSYRFLPGFADGSKLDLDLQVVLTTKSGVMLQLERR
ncbi:putative cytochrome P450 4s3 [Frankliniella fusca]|uniref:Cytochrome P450 4s3 n=1 Tax=Frankliniella fusca TaxID=407009 RepID=A0AAE1H092_9NEOP|nr:putative cytochrome P450 4s3 [Frankliniella fusca]